MSTHLINDVQDAHVLKHRTLPIEKVQAEVKLTYVPEPIVESFGPGEPSLPASSPLEIVQEALRRRAKTPDRGLFPFLIFNYVNDQHQRSFDRKVYPTRWYRQDNMFYGWDTAAAQSKLFRVPSMTNVRPSW